MEALPILGKNLEVSIIWNLEQKDEKRILRGHMKNIRNGLPQEVRADWDRRIKERLLELLDQESAVYCYVSYGTESDTKSLIPALLQKKIKVAVPRVSGQEMKFFWIAGMEDLTYGFHGIWEPKIQCQMADAVDAPVITPGLAFSKNGGRLGYGGGYYDRFFEKEPEHIRLGISYSVQLCDEVPMEETDYLLHGIITEKELVRCMEIPFSEGGENHGTYRDWCESETGIRDIKSPVCNTKK